MTDTQTKPAPETMLYLGRPVETLTREELIEAIYMMAREVRSVRESHMQTLSMWSACRSARG